ncbi:hypothetical protein GLUCORHAEAF1_13500 [Komagataeibacter rhaeticus AF1]|nr:hypothetical protein GLUCORHAEAF1_13500 [Komagataeibacter rhaeticus AF1]
MITFAQRLLPRGEGSVDRNTHAGGRQRKAVCSTEFIIQCGGRRGRCVPSFVCPSDFILKLGEIL